MSVPCSPCRLKMEAPKIAAEQSDHQADLQILQRMQTPTATNGRLKPHDALAEKKKKGKKPPKPSLARAAAAKPVKVKRRPGQPRKWTTLPKKPGSSKRVASSRRADRPKLKCTGD